MTEKIRDQSGEHQVTPKVHSDHNVTVLASRTKALITALAAGERLPIGLADWLIRYCSRGEVQ
jgi:hypothetical protein